MAIKPIEVEYVLKDGITAGAKTAGKSVGELGKEATRAGQKIKEGLSRAEADIKTLERQVARLEKQLAQLPPSAMRDNMQADLAVVQRVVAEERNQLSQLDGSMKKTEGSVRSLSGEQRRLTQALAEMRLAGKANTEEYRQMAARASELTDALADVRQETASLAHDNSGFVGITTGLQGVSGAFTAVTGAMSLFVGESEELQRIQTRLQAVMAITLGIQQALDVANKSSAFSTITLAKAKTLLTAANVRLATALGISTVAAQALMATLTLGLSAAITALVVLWNKYADSQEQQKRILTERIEAERSARSEVFKSRVELQNTIRSVRQFNGTKQEEQRKVKELNATYGATFGYYSTLAQWYDVLSRKGEAYVQSLLLQAKIQKAIAKAAEADGKVAEIEATPEDEYRSVWDKFRSDAHKNHGQRRKREALETAQRERNLYMQEAQKLEAQMNALAQKHQLGGVGDRLTYEDPEEAKRKAKEAKRKAEERTKVIKETSAALKQSIEKSEASISAATIAIMREGYAKQRAEVQHEWGEERKRIEKEGVARLELIKKLRERGAKISFEEELAARTQTDAELASNDSLKAARLKMIDKEERKDWMEYLSAFRDFAARRKAIEEAYTKDVAKLRAAQNEGNKADIERAIAEAGRQRREALLGIDREEAEATRSVTDTITRLYEDTAEKSTLELKRIIAETEALIEYLKKTPAEALTDFGGVSAAQLRLAKADPQGIKALEEGVKRIKGEVGGRSPFEGFFKAWHEGVADIKKGGADNVGKGVEKIGTAVQGIMPSIKALGKSLGDLFGDTELADNVTTLATTIEGVGSAAVGVGKMMSGDLIGGAMGVLQGIGSIISMASRAEEAHREALRRVHEAQLAYEREYQSALLRTKLLARDASTAFGDDHIRKAREALKVYADAQKKYQETLRGQDVTSYKRHPFYAWDKDAQAAVRAYERGVGILGSTRVVTGHEKTGLFGWGAGRDVYSSLLDTYPKLIKANGELDEQMLRSIISSQKLADGDKERLEGLLELSKVAKEAEEAFEGYLSSTFGSLGDSMADALISSIKAGGDALEIFASDAHKTLEGLLKQSLFSGFFRQHFEDYQKKLREAYKTSDGTNIVSEVTNLTKSLVGSLREVMPSARAAAEAGLQAMREAGLHELSSAQTAKAGAFATLTQDQGTKLEGLFTSGQMHWASIDDQLGSLTGELSGALDSLRQIERNTAPIATILEEMQRIRRDGLTIN